LANDVIDERRQVGLGFLNDLGAKRIVGGSNHYLFRQSGDLSDI